MSYILEALKKAQSERQLGSAPTLHAMPIQAAAAAAPQRHSAAWLVAGGAVLLAVAAASAWWLKPAPMAPAAASVPAAPVVVAVPVPVPAAAPLIQAPPTEAPPAPEKPAPAPVAPEPAEEVVPYLRELPEALQREVPQVVFGGYIYSKNPADRLLLVDKNLRREGEQVAPGLVLEKLQSTSAVMNYRGTRYRQSY